MFINLITCSCKIQTLIENDVSIHIKTVFGCCQEKNLKYFVSKCENCLFQINYLACANCCCNNSNKKTDCNYCRNYRARKVCFVTENIDQLPFDVFPLENCLLNLKAQAFFVFDE